MKRHRTQVLLCGAVLFLCGSLSFGSDTTSHNGSRRHDGGLSGLKNDRQKNQIPAAVEETLDFDIQKAVKPGSVTIVHFHMPDLVASVREGNYVDALAKDSKGAVKVVRVVIARWENPLIEKYGLTSLPQFWFFGRTGKLSKKLTERFTEIDIDEALKAARK